MAKKKIEKPKRVVTKRQLSRWQRHKRRQRLIRGLGISVIIAVVGLVSAGIYYQWYLPEVKPLRDIVTEVNSTKFNMDYYIKALKYQAGDQYIQYVQYFLDPVLENIQKNELIRQKALALGISVSDSEVDEALGGSELSVNQAVRDMVRAQLLVTKLGEEYFEPQVPLSAEQRYIMAMFLEGENQAVDVRARLEAGEDFGGIASELSLDSLTKENSGDLGWLPDGVISKIIGTSVLDSLITEAKIGVLSEGIYDEALQKSVGYWLIKVIAKDTETGTATVQAMLLGSEEEAEEVLAQLDAGGDFATLAEEYSQTWSSTTGCEVDVTTGSATTVFEGYALDPDVEIGVVSSILRDEEETTTGGYWLFEVTDRDTLDISDANRKILLDNKLNDWLESLWDDPENTVVSYLDEEMRAFAINRVSGG